MWKLPSLLNIEEPPTSAGGTRRTAQALFYPKPAAKAISASISTGLGAGWPGILLS